jgi:cytoskeletal protein RodZ
LTAPAESAGTSAERLAVFGRWLTRERELRGLARDEVIRAMKLAPGVIEALESGEEGRMPPRAYAVGCLRAYSAAVGLDADEVVLRFEEAAGPAAAAARRRRSGPSPRTIAALVLAGAVVAGVLWALLRS